ncbi:hypothetical protein SDC9_172766 [bioreactor metagenome]|uniref:Clp ATPase C-terminal domain-containing protein n=1 Tax=bioreactor metagenome TaxID=1076179 RepID=A0A645GEL1_9ZZZZ
MKASIEESVKQIFNPEFVNRVDEFIIFHNLDKEQIFQIIDLNLADVVKRLSISNISLELTTKAKEFLAEQGYDEKFGARPLRRQIQNHIENELAEEILKGNLPNFSKVIADYDEENKKIIFNIVKPEEIIQPTEENNIEIENIL